MTTDYPPAGRKLGMQVQLEQRRMMWKLRSPNDLDARTSRGGAHKLQLDRGFFCHPRPFPRAKKYWVFAEEVILWKRTIVVNNFVCLQLVLKYNLLNQF